MFLTLAMPEYKFQGMCGHLRRGNGVTGFIFS
jgi:hypothetical protein